MLSFAQEKMILPIASFGKSGELTSKAARMLNNSGRNPKPIPKKHFIAKVSGKLSLECNRAEDEGMLPPRLNRSSEGDKQEHASIDETTTRKPNCTGERERCHSPFLCGLRARRRPGRGGRAQFVHAP